MSHTNRFTSYAASRVSDRAAFPASRRGAGSTVVICRNDGVRKSGGALDGAVLDRMVESALRELTGAPTAEKAWKELFTPRDVVGIKVNCLAGRGLSSHPELVQGIVRGLRSAGIPEMDKAEATQKQAG